MYPITALWSHPRSMSTAMERMMRERGDLDCAHEPFMYDYYVHRRKSHFAMFDVRDDHPVRYADIRDMLMGRAEAGPVFFKDMSYYVWDQVLSDEGFSAALTNVFLIRDPVAAIASYFKLDPTASCEEIGLHAQWRHYAALVGRGEAPVVVEAEAVQRDPKGMMKALWSKIGMDWRDAAFDWADQVPEDWEQVEGWHGAVTQSSGIRPPDPEAGAKARARFQALADEHPVMRDYLEHHMEFYERLKAVALRG